MLESILVPPRGHPVRFRRAATTSGNGLGLSRSRDANAKRTAAARRHASWNLWRLVAEADGHPQDRAERWRDVIGPLFREVWPLDADLRGAATTRNLVPMALQCEAAFPEAVEAILDFIVPYQLYSLSQPLRLETEHPSPTGRLD